MNIRDSFASGEDRRGGFREQLSDEGKRSPENVAALSRNVSV